MEIRTGSLLVGWDDSPTLQGLYDGVSELPSKNGGWNTYILDNPQALEIRIFYLTNFHVQWMCRMVQNPFWLAILLLKM